MKHPKKYEDQDLVKCKKAQILSNRDLEDLERGHLLVDRFSKAIIINHSILKSNGNIQAFLVGRTQKTNEDTNGCYTQQ